MYMYIYSYMYMYMYIYIYSYMYMYMYVLDTTEHTQCTEVNNIPEVHVNINNT